MSEHARLSFSAAERWFRCPASVSMSEGIPDTGGSDASKEGTFAHSLMEKTLKSYLLGTGHEVLCPTFPEDANGWEAPEKMMEHIQECVDYIVDEYENFPGEDIKMYLEERVDLHYMSGRDDTWGTADVRIESTECLAVYDLKYGKGIYVEDDTKQNRLYLLAGMCDTLRATRGVAPWESCFGMIMQPRFRGPDGEMARGVEFTPDELMEWFNDEVFPKMSETDAPGEPCAGDWCRWCKRNPTCPAAQAKVAEMLPFEPAEPVGEVFSDGLDADIHGMEIEKLIQIHDNAPFISAFLKSVDQRLRTLIEDRDPALDGRLKLVVSRRNTKYNKDESEIIADMVAGKGKTVKDGYIPRNKFVKESCLSASQALKLKLNDAQQARLQQHIVKSDGSLTIVPWSDPRDNAFPAMPFEDQTKVESAQLSGAYDFL